MLGPLVLTGGELLFKQEFLMWGFLLSWLSRDKRPKKKKEKQPAIRKEGVVLRPSFLMDLFLYVFFFSEDWVKQVT